ncbi:hypothetical protein [Saccharothrix longispora]|uniref:hypothetical protein n=1 Tax=Saccharothrix longispora TaxID=33920 RepID=UPI0028FD7DBB|nr:hypothetical protein [Saccharothrix longispora]MDU0288377.1 hypothetical protein [Saccharothrix longispora]
MDDERGNAPGQDYDDVSRAPLDEQASGPLDDEGDGIPGRSDSGSTHPEANPTGSVGLADYSNVDPDNG